jgi:prepilin-type processing-associated H-X9-DG protein
MSNAHRRRILGMIAAGLLIAAPASAATLNWDANGTLPVNGGTGPWDTTSLLWETNRLRSSTAHPGPGRLGQLRRAAVEQDQARQAQARSHLHGRRLVRPTAAEPAIRFNQRLLRVRTHLRHQGGANYLYSDMHANTNNQHHLVDAWLLTNRGNVWGHALHY